jgi:hypothetical protein
MIIVPAGVTASTINGNILTLTVKGEDIVTEFPATFAPDTSWPTTEGRHRLRLYYDGYYLRIIECGNNIVEIQEQCDGTEKNLCKSTFECFAAGTTNECTCGCETNSDCPFGYSCINGGCQPNIPCPPEGCGSGPAPSCGDTTCNGGETTFTCYQDCPLDIGSKRLWMHPHTTSNWIEEESPWDTVVNSIHVFGLFGDTVKTKPLSMIQTPLLKSKGVAISVEIGALRPYQCDGTTYFMTVDKPIFDKLVNAGHTDFIASMDAPFTYTLYDGFHSQCYQLYEMGIDPLTVSPNCKPQPKNCDYTIDEATNEVIEYLKLFHQYYPEAEIGLIEPLPLLNFGGYGSSQPIISGHTYPDFEEIIDSLIDKILLNNAGSGLDISLNFYHIDASITSMKNKEYNIWGKHVAVASHVKEKGLRFGILFNSYLQGSTPEENSQNFVEGVLQYYDCWLYKGGFLDDIIVESWIAGYPQNNIPEEDPLTFTYAVKELIGRLVDPAYTPTCSIS